MGLSPLSRRLQEEVQTKSIKPLTPSRGDAQRTSRALSETPSMTQTEERPRISNVRVLNTSLPHVHDELMQIREKAKAAGEDPDLISHPSQVSTQKEPDSAHVIPEEVKDEQGNPIYRSKEEQDATSKALKPHSRSVTAMSELRTLMPEKMTTIPQSVEEKKPPPSKVKPRRWQFGIRSRNQPYEAMKCLFNALYAQGAEWEIVPATAFDNSQDGEDERDGMPPPPPELEPGERHSALQSKYSYIASDYYIPRDPWNIRARILKRGMLMPGEEPTISANSSAVSLPNEAKSQLKRHIESLGGYASNEVGAALGLNGGNTKSPSSSGYPSRQNTGHGDAPQLHGHDAFTGPGQPLSRPESLAGLGKKIPGENIGVWVFIDIQLYTLESGVYVVDFKCDGYQNVILTDPKKEGRAKSPQNSSGLTSPSNSRPTSGLGNLLHGGTSSQGTGNTEGDDEPYWRPMSKRYRNVEKEISSPYPYLDVASDLVAQLASQPSG